MENALNVELPLSRAAHLLRQPVTDLILEIFDLASERESPAPVDPPLGFSASWASDADTLGIDDDDY